jgi:phospholipid-translocating ATPase
MDQTPGTDRRPSSQEQANQQTPPPPASPITSTLSTATSQAQQYQWLETEWQSLRVGDIIYLKNDEPIPADIVILSTSEPDCMCYVETKNLDGETNLKLKQGPIETSSISTPEECARRLKLIIDSEAPTTNMLRYQSTLNIFGDYSIAPASNSRIGSGDLASSKQTVGESLQQASKFQVNGSADLNAGKKLSIDINGLLMRGSVIRNTKWTIGIVVFTGEDTKQIMNSGKTPSKRSQMEKLMNFHVVVNLAFMLLLCMIASICYTEWLRKSLASNAPFIEYASLYTLGQEGFVNYWYEATSCFRSFQIDENFFL